MRAQAALAVFGPHSPVICLPRLTGEVRRLTARRGRAAQMISEISDLELAAPSPVAFPPPPPRPPPPPGGGGGGGGGGCPPPRAGGGAPRVVGEGRRHGGGTLLGRPPSPPARPSCAARRAPLSLYPP